MSIELSGCELPEYGDQPKGVGARWDEICISTTCAVVGTKNCTHSQWTGK